MRKIWLFIAAILMAATGSAQEINFSRVQDMAVWYNQSLKTDKQGSVKLNYRNVQFGGLIAYNSISAIADMPLISREKKESENSGGYFSLSAGAASDKSNSGILNNTLGLLGVSYAVPLGNNETYAAAGFQGTYYTSTLKTDGSAQFQEQFDKYGPIDGAVSSDQYAGGWSYGYFNVNAGISVFNNSAFNKWYIGVSVQHINKPYTDQAKSKDFRLRQALGVQGGYRFSMGEEGDEIGVYASLNWQGKAYKHFFNAQYSVPIRNMAGTFVGGGLGYRYGDAIVPNLEIKYNKFLVGICYDVNISEIAAAGYKRNGLELALKLDF